MPYLREALSQLSRVFAKGSEPSANDDRFLSRLDKLNTDTSRSHRVPRLFRE